MTLERLGPNDAAGITQQSNDDQQGNHHGDAI